MERSRPMHRVVRDAVAAFLGEADFAGHPLAEIEEEGVGVGLEFGDAISELIREVGVVIEQFGTRMDDGFGAERGDVVGIEFERGG